MLKDKILTDLKEAMIAKEVTKRDILRFVISQIKNKEIDTKKDLTDDEIIKLLQKEIKQIGETKEGLEASGDTEGIEIENTKIEVLGAYLPEMISEKELEEITKSAISALGIEEPKKNRGPIIGKIMAEYGASVDGKILNDIINRI